MRPLAEAQADVLDAVEPLPPVAVPVWEAGGLCCVNPVLADSNVPPFANSAMDGYAVIAADTVEPPVTLRVLDAVAAGHTSSATVVAGSAIQIMTGAPVPAGADAVVKVEDTHRDGDEVTIQVTADPGLAIRPAGSDIGAGSVLVDAGVRLRPSHVALLATAGAARPTVHRRPRVAVLSTGDEVKAPETPELEPGWIRDANRPLLVGLLDELGVDVSDYGIVPDDASALRSTLVRAAAECDAVATSGGVSMGEYDLVKQILAELGGVDLWRVAMQPAKPFAFGMIDDTPFFGLPGNPVSVFVSFEQFLRPALLRMMGSTRLFRPRIGGTMEGEWTTDPAKEVFVRVALSWVGPGAPVARLPGGGGQGSHVLSTMAAADAFAVVPVGADVVRTGSRVTLEMFQWPEGRTRTEAIGG